MAEDQKPSRAHKRYDVDWRVSMKCPDWKIAGHVAAANASRGGLFVLTPQPPPIGTIVELGIELPDGVVLRLRGTVQHQVTPERAAASGESPGIGIKFLEEHDTDLVLLEQMASAGTRTKSAPPPPPPGPSPPAQAAARGRPVLGQIAVRRLALPKRGEAAPIVGIDFGNSYASVAAAIGGRLFVIPDEEQRTLQPCVVHVPAEGPPYSGWEAHERLIDEPRRTVASPRRLIGRAIDDPTLAVHLAGSLVRIVADDDGAPWVEIEEQRHDPETLCAAILDHLKSQAERALNMPVGQAVLALAPHFDEARFGALRRAADAAALELVDLVPEPVAAAMSTGAEARVGSRVLVIDVGGGTTTATLLEGEGGSFRVLDSEWDGQLGGDDLDEVLAQAVADEFWRATAIEVRTRVDGWLRLVRACERAKRALSFADDAVIAADELIADPRYDLLHPVERRQLEGLAVEVIARCLTVCRKLLERTGVHPLVLASVVLAGGCARVPCLRAHVAQTFETEPLVGAQPDEVTCLGAGRRAARLARHRLVGG